VTPFAEELGQDVSVLGITSAGAFQSVGAAVLSSAVVAGVVSAVLAGRHERARQLRGKMLDVADAFVSDLLEAGKAVKEVDVVWGEGPLVERELARAGARIAAARVKLGRIMILYGPRSRTAGSARLALALMAAACVDADARIKTRQEGSVADYLAHVDAADAEVEAFTEEAARALRNPLRLRSG
jgi:hypothetical protein